MQTEPRSWPSANNPVRTPGLPLFFPLPARGCLFGLESLWQWESGSRTSKMLTSGSPGELLPACLALRNKVFLCGFRTTAWIFGFEFRSLPLRGVGDVA